MDYNRATEEHQVVNLNSPPPTPIVDVEGDDDGSGLKLHGLFGTKSEINPQRDELQVVEASTPLLVTVLEQYCVSGLNGVANTFKVLIEHKSGRFISWLKS